MMANDTEPFELEFKNLKLRVQRHTIAGNFVYHIIFQDKRPPLVITRASAENGGKWWTSIPEGRQREADEIGPLIENHIKSNQ